MGLEAINFSFHSKEPLEEKLALNKEIKYIKENKYVLNMNDNFWIDLELQSQNSLSIRITLCNPTEPVLEALFNLVGYLFKGNGQLIEMRSKQVYQTYNDELKENLKKLYFNQKKKFQEIYGDYTAAIGSEEFYRRQKQI